MPIFPADSVSLGVLRLESSVTSAPGAWVYIILCGRCGSSRCRSLEGFGTGSPEIPGLNIPNLVGKPQDCNFQRWLGDLCMILFPLGFPDQAFSWLEQHRTACITILEISFNESLRWEEAVYRKLPSYHVDVPWCAGVMARIYIYIEPSDSLQLGYV